MVIAPQGICRTFIILLILCLVSPQHASSMRRSAKQPDSTLELSIRSSANASFRSTLIIQSSKWSDWIKDLKRIQPRVRSASYSILELSVKKGSGNQLYQWDDMAGLLYQSSSGEDAGQAYKPPTAMVQAIRSVSLTLHQNHYGKAADWPEAKRQLPRGAYLIVTDLETGLRFHGQRRAGSAHADVQPLTKQDSAIMKQIYGGHWSWNRRAILVQTPEGSIAASMHGMPHGGDGIPGNQFDGHFCIHFDGTVTHGSGQSDPAHQVMVHKAAGQLEAYHRSLSPDQVAELFLLSANQKDSHLTGLLLNPEAAQADFLKKEWLDPAMLSARRIDAPSGAGSTHSNDTNALSVQLNTRISIGRMGSRPQAIEFVWQLSRAAPGKPWVIDSLDPKHVIK